MGVALSIISIIIGAAAVISLLVTAARTSGSGRLARGLRKLGDPTGRTEAEFVTAFGRNPTSISAMPTGERLLQWQTGGQHIAVMFTDEHRFVQITHRHQV